MRGRLKKTHLLATGAVIAIALVFSFFFFNSNITGQSILNIEGNIVDGQLEAGKLNFLLNEGELIPTDTKILIENDNQTYEYFLSEIISSQEIEGNYYLKGTLLSGEGTGFGKAGKIIEEPEISFEFEIVSKNESTTTSGGSTKTDEKINSSEEVIIIGEENTTEGDNNTEPSLEENTTEGTSLTEESTNESETETNTENESSNAEETTDTTTGDTTTPTETTLTEETPEETTITPTEETPTETNPSEETQSPEESSTESTTEESTPVEESSPEPATSKSPSEQASESPSVVEVATAAVAGFFLPITGRVTEVGSIVSGTVKKGNDFTYSGLTGKKVKIVTGSVKVNGEEVDENLLETSIDNDGNLVITTDYSLSDEGFGEKYLSSETEKISIDLNELNVSLKEGPVTIKLIYNETEYFSMEEKLTQSFIEELNKNATVIENVTNITIIPDEKFNFNLSLTEDEKDLIKNNVNFPVVSTDVKETENRYTAEFTIGDYSTLHTYPKTLSEEALRKNIERDRMLWLQDIANTLNEKKFTNTTTLGNLSQDYPIF